MAQDGHGLHFIAAALHQHRPDLRRTADPLPVARACRDFAGSAIHHGAIVVARQVMQRVSCSQVWEITLPLAGER
jgi:hypothetical protein